MGRYLDALRAKKYGEGGNLTNLNNPSGDSCLGLLGTPPTLISESEPVRDQSEPRVDSAIPEPDPVAESDRSRGAWEFAYQERAAILEYDAGLIRIEAERQAREMTDAERMGYWSQAETVLCLERTRQFVRRGVPEMIADELACRLVERDRQEDTRRSCAECRAFRNGGCVQGKQPVAGGGVEVLHRCKTFIDPEVKHD